MKTPSLATLTTQLPLHTWSGILTSLVLLICFLAGSLSVYRDTLNRWATPPQTAHPYDPAQTAALIRATLAAHPEPARPRKRAAQLDRRAPTKTPRLA